MITIKKLTNKLRLLRLVLGEKKLKKNRIISIKNIEIVKPNKWDRKWRLVLFDLPSELVTECDSLRKKLDELGFVTIGVGIYIHPYECFEAIESLTKLYNLDSYARYEVVNDIKETERLIVSFSERVASN